jgi:MerR family transcriptional regulator, mercuric resistance operon regulatory protein
MKTIGKAAKELGINIETIRYYEKKGLIEQPKKPSSGYRHYSQTTIKSLRFILKAKSLGFTLNEISTLLSLSGNCKEVESLGLKKLTLIRQKIADLQRLELVICEMTKSCQRNNKSDNCPIIESLNT